MRYVLAAAFCTSFAASAVLVIGVRALARRLAFTDEPDGRKAHSRPVPLGGGVAIYAATALPLAAISLGALLWRADPDLFSIPDALQTDVLLAAERAGALLAVLGCGLGAMLFGLWDDVRDLRPGAKAACQFAVALGAALVPEARVGLFLPSPVLQVAVTVVWIMALMNCFNLLDNTDGQSGLVAVLCGCALLIVALQTDQHFVAGLLLSLTGAVLGFLLFNLPPASVFMGDAGSMFVGYLLAVGTTLTTFVEPGRMNPLFPVLVPLIIFSVPLYDALSVVGIRLWSGRSIATADRSHFSHRLMALGMREGRMLLTVGLIVTATTLGATVPYGSSTWRVAAPTVQTCAMLLVILQLELVGSSPEPE